MGARMMSTEHKACRQQFSEENLGMLCHCEMSGSPASAYVMRLHYSVMYAQLLRAISGLIAVGRVGNLLCGRPSCIIMPGIAVIAQL